MPDDDRDDHGGASGPRRRIGTGAAAVLVLAVGLVGGFVWGHHAGSGSVDTVGGVAGRASATDHDAADVRFAEQMLPHHDQALAMVAMVDAHTDSTAVRTLAGRISAAQQPEVATLQAWLTSWHGKAATGQMDGMMSDAEMRQLDTLSGADFDRAWLTMMIQHHQGAVAMTRDELASGEYADTLGLAASIQVTQQAEIEQMRDLLTGS